MELNKHFNSTMKERANPSWTDITITFTNELSIWKNYIMLSLGRFIAHDIQWLMKDLLLAFLEQMQKENI